MKIFKALILTFLTFPLSASADSPDIDGNGFNDILGISIAGGKNKKFTWNYVPAGPGTLAVSTKIKEFGKGNDIPVPGRYSNPNMTDPAFVRLTDEGLEWRIIPQNGDTVVIQFGDKNDSVYGGADIDGDGYDDLLIRNKSGLFTFRRTGFGPNLNTVSFSQKIGKAKDQNFVTDIDNDGQDEICRVAKKPGTNKKRTTCFDFFSKHKVFNANAGKKANGTPKPLGANLLGFIREKGKGANKKTTVRVQELQGKYVSKTSFDGHKNIVTTAPAQLAAKNGTVLEVFDAFSKQKSSQTAPDVDDVYDEYNVGSFKVSGGKGGGAGNTQCTSTTSWGNGSVWKPISEGDGKLVILDNFGANSSKAYVINQNGNVLGTGNYVGKTNGGRPTFRFSKSGSSFGSNIIAVFQSSSSNVCRNVANGGTRYD
ncbi:MAG: VCBS repeat-containing protein [Deltaproteobacteria bacterium]|nr:VCBS repeat-containing protein [Deltaproteobacteria bacterium]